MQLRLSAILILLSWPLFSETTEIMYYNFFGEYLVEDSYTLDLDVQNMSLAELKQTLAKQRDRRNAIDADLVVIGYGPDGDPDEFFAASQNVNDRTPLKLAIDMPTRDPDSRFRIYFVNKFISSVVLKRQDHHWASPLRWLAQIGLQDLVYFGSAR